MKTRLFVLTLLLAALTAAIFIYSKDFAYTLLCLTVAVLIIVVINLVERVITIVKFYSEDL